MKQVPQVRKALSVKPVPKVSLAPQVLREFRVFKAPSVKPARRESLAECSALPISMH